MAARFRLGDAAQINELKDAIAELEGITGKPGVEILRRIMRTQTLESLGCDGTGFLTYDQRRAAIRICRHWIKQALERKETGDG